ncbi:MAG TPA: bifunctional DNA primase/polymerase [Anaerolineae bacterium]|nr:bifunctional DNA primase/polymerase [Anaerolineae bacterium]
MSNETLQKAIELNTKGCNLVFYEPGKKGSDFHWKHWKTQRQTVMDLIELVRHYPHYTNMGVICGQISKLLVLDFDLDKPGKELDFENFSKLYPSMLNTKTVQTGRGFHLWYAIEYPIPMRHPLCEVWHNSDHYASVEGNIHPSGAVYTALNEYEPKQITISDLLNSGCSLQHLPERGKKIAVTETNGNHFLPSFPADSANCPKWYGIPGDACNRIKAQLNVIDFLHITETVKRGKRFFARCPQHNDGEEPDHWSLEVQSERVSCYNPECILYDANKHGYDVIDVYALLAGVDSRRAKQILLYSLGI